MTLSKYAQLSDADVRGQFSLALTFFFAICFNIPGGGGEIRLLCLEGGVEAHGLRGGSYRSCREAE